MGKKKMFPEKEINMRDLYPHLTDEELIEAEENLNRDLGPAHSALLVL